MAPRLRLTPTDREVVGWWALTRLGLLLVAVSGPWLLARGEPGTGIAGSGVAPFWDRVAQWDVHHFVAIARTGYDGTAGDPTPSGAPLEAFFPGLPALLRVGFVLGLDPVVAGVLLSLVASAVAAVALSRLAAHELGDPARGSRVALAWLVAPTAVFCAVPYTEAVFCALAFPAWLAARRGQWRLAAALTAGAACIRVSGLFLAVALVVEFAVSGRRRWRSAGWLLLPAVPLLGFSVYLWQLTGDPLAWYHAQEQEWFRGFTWPWQALALTWDAAQPGFFTPPEPDFTWMFRAELVAMAVGLMLTGWLLWRRRWSDATWIGLQVAAFGTSQWFFSMPRATLLWWPLWIALAAVSARRPWLFRAYLALAVPLGAVWSTAYLTASWAG